MIAATLLGGGERLGRGDPRGADGRVEASHSPDDQGCRKRPCDRPGGNHIERWIAWQGVDGEIDARAGGVLQIRMPGGQVASGRFIEVIPEQRLVFTWGWEGEAPRVPPGSTTVVIELAPDEAGTLLRLTHSALAPPPAAEHHRAGWERYLERLKIRAEGGDPGADLAENEPNRTSLKCDDQETRTA